MQPKTEEADEALNITKNKTIHPRFHHRHLLPEIFLRFGATTFAFLEMVF